jgi:putative ABC transport system permease protein
VNYPGGARIKPLGILHLYRVRLRTRFVQEGLAALGIAAGVALLFASQVASTSLTGSVRQLTDGLVGQSRLQVRARAPEGFSESILGEVQRLPGVRSAEPVLDQQANVVGPRGERAVDFIGADPNFIRLGGRLLRHFSAAALARQHAVALPTPTAQQIGVGSLQPVTLQLGARSAQVLVGATLQQADIGALVDSPVVLAPLRYAQQLAGMPGRITRIFVQPAPGRDGEVRAELTRLAGGRLNVEPADLEATLFEHAAASTNESTSLFAAISALVGFLFAANAMLFTAPARRRFIAQLRLDGYSPMSVMGVLLFDALVLGIVASVLGLALGEELSARLLRTNPGFLSLAFSVGSQRIITAQSIAIAFAAGLLAACLGVLAPLQDIFSARPLAAIRPRARNPNRRRYFQLAGVLCLALTTTILFASPDEALIGVVSLTVALMLLLPSLIRGVLAVVERATLDLRAAAPFIAINELRARSTWARTIAIAGTGAIAVFGSVSIQGAHADLQRGLDHSAHDVSSAAAVWAFPRGPANLLATTPFPADATGTLAGLPGVRAVLAYRGGFLDLGDRRVWVSGPPRAQPGLIPARQLVSGSLASADARLREGGWAVVSQAIADEWHLHIGQKFLLPSPRPTNFRVAALSTNIGWPPGAIIINADDYARAWDSSNVSAYQIVPQPGVAPQTVRNEARRAIGSPSGLTVQTAVEREQHQRAASRQGLARLSQISTLVLVAAVLAMAAAMGNMVWGRRQRLARLKLDGHTGFQLWRALLFESVLLLAAACSIGAVFGLYGQLLGSHAILTVTGFPVVFSVAAVIALTSLAVVVIAAALVLVVPGYFVARVRPQSGLSD